MKFTIAAGILIAQSLPAVSDDSAAVAADVVIRLAEGSNQHDLNVPQDMLSLAMHSPKLQQLLKNKRAPSASRTQKNCDPSSDDLDVGVLSCDVGYDCVPDELSILGGFCVSTSRDLQAVDYCDLCGYASTVGYSKISVATGYQDFTCGDLAFASYGDNVTLTTEQCTGSAQLAKSAGCCVSYDCNVCGDLTFNGNLTFSVSEYSCGANVPLLNETVCAYYTEYLSGFCCEGGEAMTPTAAPGSSAGSDIPTTVVPETPTAEVPGATEAPAPSGSATMWSEGTFLSAVGLAVAATAGGLLLN